MCVSPITIKIGGTGRFSGTYKQVPCGKCIECSSSYQNDWSYRLNEEAKEWKHVYFFTLTYNDSSLPLLPCIYTGEVVPSVCKDDIQRWLKRGRQSFLRATGRKLVMRYFICSEYGPNTCRPHYHGIFFTNEPLSFMCQHFLHPWSVDYGFIKFKEVEPYRGSEFTGVTGYIAKYCSKPAFASHLRERMGLVNPTFRIMSKGISSNARNYVRNTIYAFYHDKFCRELETQNNGDLNEIIRKYTSSSCTSQEKLIYSRYIYKNMSLEAKERLGHLYDSLTYIIENQYGQFRRRLPRYISDYARYNTVRVVRERYDARIKKFTSREVKEYFRDNDISYLFDLLLLERNVKLYNDKFAEIQANNPSWSDAEINSEIDRQHEEELDRRGKQRYERMYQWYLNKKTKSLNL